MKANRALFKKYIHTTHQKEKHLIEKKFVEDDFVMDALEGYNQEPNAWSALRLRIKSSSKPIETEGLL
jgi:hypothetical protein